MISTEANPFGNVKIQPRLSPASSESVQFPTSSTPSAFVLPKTNQAVLNNAQLYRGPNPMILASSALGFNNLANYLFGNKVGTSSSNPSKTTGTSFVESTGWEEDIDPETGEPRELQALNRLPSFLQPEKNPFSSSLDFIS